MAKEVTYLRLPPEAKREIERIAQAEGRTLSSLLRLIVNDWLKTHKERERKAA